jgi:hypothetical protein
MLLRILRNMDDCHRGQSYLEYFFDAVLDPNRHKEIFKSNSDNHIKEIVLMACSSIGTSCVCDKNNTKK